MEYGKLYLEAHVTLDPVFDDELERVKGVCLKHNFKVATLLMQKRAEDTPERSRFDTFTTAHSKSLDDIKERTIGVVQELKLAGIKVRRYKIEDTVLDSRAEDVLGIL